MSSQENDLNDYLKVQHDKEGILMKLSSKNVWQKRYYQIRGPYLMYWASQSSTKKGISKGNLVGTPNVSIDLRLINSVDILKGNVLVLTSKSKQMFSLKSINKNDEKVAKDDITSWYDIINDQIIEEKRSSITDTPELTKQKQSRPTVLVTNMSIDDDDDDVIDGTKTSSTGKNGAEELGQVEEEVEEVEEKVDESQINEQMAAATKVQAITRQKMSQKKVENIRKEKEQEKQEKATLKIQGIVRQKDAKKKVNLVRENKTQETEPSSENTTPPTNETGDAVVATVNEVVEDDDEPYEKFASNYRGLLDKAGHFVNTGWKTRVFVLTRDANNYNYWSLNYYVDEGQGRLGEKKGEIELKNAILEDASSSTPLEAQDPTAIEGQDKQGNGEGAGEDNQSLFEFTIISTDKTFPLKASSKEIATEWLKRLKCAIKENNKNHKAITNLNTSAIDRASNGEAIAVVIGDGNTGGPSFRGVLEKAGHFLNTSYKSRLFVLAETPPANDWVLFYYLDEGQGRLGELKGEIKLKGAILEEGKGVDFNVITKERKDFPLRALDEETANKWKEKIQQAIDLSK